MTKKHSRVAALVMAASLTLLTCSAASAADATQFTRKGATYENVKLDLENAIIAEGLKIDYRGDINGMLKRTGADVGSNQPVYQNAEFLTFCSSKLSRAMMEADPSNMSQCPYVVFVYQRATAQNEVVVGYRKVVVEGPGKKALEEINRLLERIVQSAAK